MSPSRRLGHRLLLRHRDFVASWLTRLKGVQKKPYVARPSIATELLVSYAASVPPELSISEAPVRAATAMSVKIDVGKYILNGNVE
jgi:hypothetical protein